MSTADARPAQRQLEQLLATPTDRRLAVIAPSILAGDSARLADAVQEAEAAGADWIHVDVMDGVFVPPITFGAQTVTALRAITDLPLDVHLMTTHPERHVAAFAAAGADIITVHVESTTHVHRLLEDIRERGARPGLALVPSTAAAAVRELLDDVDLVLVMTVDPGYGGQALIERCLHKVRELAVERTERGAACLLEVDGGINAQTTAAARRAGAEVFVAGTAVFGADDPRDAIHRMRIAGGSPATSVA